MIKNGITLLSAHDPEAKCKKIANVAAIHDKTLYFCPSPLYGYGLDTFLERLKKEAPNSSVLCIEADPELYELSVSNINKNLFANNKLQLTNICEAEKLCAFIRKTYGARAFRKIEMIKFTGGWQLAPDLYNSLFETLRREIALDWSNVLTLTKLGRLYIRNLLRNLSLIPHWKSIEDLSFRDSDILVLGAGPSLDEALDNLPEVRNFKIVCVDTCLGALKDRNIVPDLAVILESQHWNMRDFIGCCGWNIPVAFDFSALPQSATVLTGQGYLFFTPWTELAIFERMREANLLPAVVPPLGSVGLCAMEIASRLTTGKITFAGFDFCFSIDKYHARGTPGHREKLNTHNRFGGLIGGEAFGFSVTRDGTQYSTPNMRNYRELFESEFSKEISHREHRGSVCKQTEERGENLDEFIKIEIERLRELRDVLTSVKKQPLPSTLYTLIKECDYLWAHFPDYAGGLPPDCGNISFLNRVRVGIDPMLKLLNCI